MADRRLIAQSITNSGQVAQLVRRCGPWGAVLFTWALTYIDDDSRFEGDPETLRHRLLGRYLDLAGSELVAEIVAVMNDIDLAIWYEVVGSPGERYLYFPRFTTHQTLREDRYGPSRLPAPPNWQPEEGHPYTKNAARQAAWKPGMATVTDLRRDKPQRDLRRTARVAKRTVTGSSLWETTAQPQRAPNAPTATSQPERDQSAPAAHPLGAPAGTEDAPRPASPRLVSQDTSRLASAQAAVELRSDRGGRPGMRPACQRPGCGHGWVAHRGPGDPAFSGARECVVHDCLCTDYLERATPAHDPGPASDDAIPDDEPVRDVNSPYARARADQ